MYKYLLFLSLGMLLLCASCRLTEDRFNDGLKLNLQIVQLLDEQKYTEAQKLNKTALKKFREVFEQDSTYPGIGLVLAHCYYIDQQYDQAVTYFTKVVKHQPDAAAFAYRKLGMCKINLGNEDAAHADLKMAFQLDTSKLTRTHTITELQAFNNGKRAIAHRLAKAFLAPIPAAE